MTDEQKKDDVVTEETTEQKDSAQTCDSEEVSAPVAEEVVTEVPAKEEKKEEAVEEKKDEGEEAKAAEGNSPDASDEEASRVEVPAKFKAIVDGVESLSVLDLHELVKLLEKKFGVSAAAVAVAGPAGDGDAGGEEKSSFNIKLTAFGDSKVAVIKIVKEVCGLGLKEAKDLIEGAPVDIKKDVKKDEAEEIKKRLVEVGATVELE